MDDRERIHRAQEAARLADEPILTEALDRMYAVATEQLLSLPPEDHEKRYLAALDMRTIKGFRDRLRNFILEGKAVSQKPRVVA